MIRPISQTLKTELIMFRLLKLLRSLWMMVQTRVLVLENKQLLSKQLLKHWALLMMVVLLMLLIKMLH